MKDKKSMKDNEASEKQAKDILDFFARRCGYDSWETCDVTEFYEGSKVYCIQFFNSSFLRMKDCKDLEDATRILCISSPKNLSSHLLFYEHVPSAVEIVKNVFELAAKGYEVYTTSCISDIICLVKPHEKLEQILIEIDINIS